MLNTCIFTQTNQSSANSNLQETTKLSPDSSPTSENKKLEEKRLEFERERFNFERENEEKKLKIEESKAYWATWATAAPLLATFVALLTGIVSIWFGIYNQRKQSELQIKLKTAEIIFSGISSRAIHIRAKVLHEFFGDELSSKFASEFKPEDYELNKEPSDAKMFFIELILKYPNKEKEITKLWDDVFPGDYKWLKRFNPTYFEGIELPDSVNPLNEENNNFVNESAKSLLQEKEIENNQHPIQKKPNRKSKG